VALKSVGTPLTVAGAATDRADAYRVPFSPSGKTRDRARFIFQLREGLSNEAPRPVDRRTASPRAIFDANGGGRQIAHEIGFNGMIGNDDIESPGLRRARLA
jgi:hypothetical protein